ncbi:MAG: hypothetical protein GX902_01065 [Lentisphaerae bacterium]|nr:hypothetical protein [Lentisphaerota bacterium]
MKEFDKLFPDYLGSTPAMRTMDAAWFDRHPEELPTLEQFAQIFAEFIRDYHKTPKHGKIHQGRSPQEIWNARPNRPALTPERLKMALLRPLDIRTVGRGPAVMMDGKRYLLDKLTWGEKVIVKSESIDPDVMHCFTLDGAYIGPARTRTMVSALAQRNDEEAKKLIAEGMARGRRQLIEAKSGMFDLTDGGHLMSILELSASSVVVDNTNGDSAGRLQTPPKKQITSVKGQQHSFSRQTLPEAFPPADDTEPPKPARKIHLAPSKVDRSLLKMVHSARHDNDDDDAQEQENLDLDRRAAEENTDMDGENLNLDCRAILADT